MKPLALILVQLGAIGLLAAEPAPASGPKLDPKFPYRVSWANEHLPWYQIIPGKFPPDHSDRRIGGELVKSDTENRSGQFRLNSTGELVDFTLLPFGSVYYLNAEATLRDVPLGTQMLFFLYEDSHGKLTRVSQMVDEYTILAGHSWTCRLDEVDLKEKKITVTKQKLSKDQFDLGKSDLAVDAETRIWKGTKRIQLEELAVGDSLLMNLTGRTPTVRGRCTDIWVSPETHGQATAQQWAKRKGDLLKDGIGALVENVKDGKVSLLLFSNARKDFKVFINETFKASQSVSLAVVDERLRPSGPKGETVLSEIKSVPIEGYGSSGVRFLVDAKEPFVSLNPGAFVRVYGSKATPTEAALK